VGIEGTHLSGGIQSDRQGHGLIILTPVLPP
jgi:hypothetical protein